jgi:hypothetical protein
MSVDDDTTTNSITPGSWQYYLKSVENLEPIKEERCFKENPPPVNFKMGPVTYDDNTFEYFMWMNSLVSMCWLLSNVKHKTLDGHCYNPVHDKMKEETGHPKCTRGSEFHSKFYDNVINSLERLVRYARDNYPKVIEKQVTQNEQSASLHSD